MKNLIFQTNVRISAEFIKRVTADIGYRCEHCEKLMNPGEGYTISLYADFGPWKQMIHRTMFLCDECIEEIRREKDIDINSISPENFV